MAVQQPNAPCLEHAKPRAPRWFHSQQTPLRSYNTSNAPFSVDIKIPRTLWCGEEAGVRIDDDDHRGRLRWVSGGGGETRVDARCYMDRVGSCYEDHFGVRRNRRKLSGGGRDCGRRDGDGRRGGEREGHRSRAKLKSCQECRFT
ncbi:hypothetical protein Tco_0096679 [Tanacetum coccineum]